MMTEMRWWCAIMPSLVMGCTLRPDTYIVPLDDWDAKMVLGPDDRIFAERNTLRLLGDTDPCEVLSERTTTMLLDGHAGTMDPGNPSYSNRPCYGPAFVWDYTPPSGRPATFEISDRVTTWTFVVVDPFAQVDLGLVSSTVAPGSPVEIDIASGSYHDALVIGRDGGTQLFEMQLGSARSFILPNVVQNEIDLELNGTFDPVITRCDAPGGCAGGLAFYGTTKLTIAH